MSAPRGLRPAPRGHERPWGLDTFPGPAAAARVSERQGGAVGALCRGGGAVQRRGPGFCADLPVASSGVSLWEPRSPHLTEGRGRGAVAQAAARMRSRPRPGQRSARRRRRLGEEATRGGCE